MSVPSGRMYLERPPSAEETFRRLVGDSGTAVTSLPPSIGLGSPTSGLQSGTIRPEIPQTAQPQGDTLFEFRDIYSSPENQIFKVVFFPDRIFHAQYLNATRAPQRYRYAVSDARSVLDISVLKAQVFMDGRKLANLVRIEYRAGRLIEKTREVGRFLREEVIVKVRLAGKAFVRNAQGQVLDENGNIHLPEGDVAPKTEARIVESFVKMHFCPWINAYQVEIWQTLEPPSNTHHHFQVSAQMGPRGSITRIRDFAPVLELIDEVRTVEMLFRENDVDYPFGKPIINIMWDNNLERNYQDPRSPVPSDNDKNTIPVGNYFVNFQKGWFLDANTTLPVRYRNAMMDPGNPDYVDPAIHPELGNEAAWQGTPPPQAFKDANVIEMRWLLQRELGGTVVFFHEVTIPPGTTEGTHCHVGSEELYYIVSGEGIAYMAAGDDPETTAVDSATGKPKYNVVMRNVFGLFERECVELPVKPGNVIFTKSGGVHGIRNIGKQPLKFVAFLYHSA
ncbi:cupin domain-containing protein [Mesorhizobium sp. M0166]|uniref:cupin domain-containing protein n=1 Tax=Mesorhizobium sp. M0166 TaxID=2956902 RepID=UPI00333B94F1